MPPDEPTPATDERVQKIWRNACGRGYPMFDELREMRARISSDREKLAAAESGLGELKDMLLRKGFVKCDIAACNCGSYHHRYGLPERFDEIKELLVDAGVFNNDAGNLHTRAVAKLIEQRDAALADGAAMKKELEKLRRGL